MDRDENLLVMQTVWPWRQSSNSSEKPKSANKKHALIQFCIMFVAASVVFFIFHHKWLGGIIYCLGLLVLISFFFLPPIYSASESVSRLLIMVIGKTLTYVLLVPFYYLCFFPGRLLLNLLRKDPMKRLLETDTKTYWLDRPDAEDTDHYKVQYK